MDQCDLCRKPIDKPVMTVIDGMEIPVVIAVKDGGTYHYACWIEMFDYKNADGVRIGSEAAKRSMR